jgi:hypothetical protein
MDRHPGLSRFSGQLAVKTGVPEPSKRESLPSNDLGVTIPTGEAKLSFRAKFNG